MKYEIMEIEGEKETKIEIEAEAKDGTTFGLGYIKTMDDKDNRRKEKAVKWSIAKSIEVHEAGGLGEWDRKETLKRKEHFEDMQKYWEERYAKAST